MSLFRNDRSSMSVAALAFAQMLPATLVAPAIRPLFAALHGDASGAMHAFMALNMLGAIVAAPLVGTLADRAGSARRLLAVLASIDAALLGSFVAPMPTSLLLALRTAEGAAHVGAATVLLGRAASARRAGGGGALGLAGAAVIAAIACGSAIGGALAMRDARAPFVVASLLSLFVATAALLTPERVFALATAPRRNVVRVRELIPLARALRVPIAAAFLARFAIGCIVVSFALLAHRAHHLSDRSVGFAFTAFTATFALLAYPCSGLASRVDPERLVAWSLAAEGLAIGTLAFAPAVALHGTMIAGGAAAAALYAPTLHLAAARTSLDGRSRAMAFVHAAGCFGMLLGPAGAGIATAIASSRFGAEPGLRAPFLLAAALLVTGSLLLGARSVLVSRRSPAPF